METVSRAIDVLARDDPELLRNAARVLAAVVERDWGRPTKPVLLLRALCRLEANGLDSSEEGWDAIDLAREMAALGDKDARRWANEGEEESRKAVRRLWREVETKLWPKKHGADSVLQRRAREAGMTVYAEPKKVQGGGYGNPNSYRLQLSELREPEELSVLPRAEPTVDSVPISSEIPEIEYFTDDVSVPRLLHWIPVDGLRTRSRVGVAMLGLFSVTGMLGLWAALVSVWLLIAVPTTLAFLKQVVLTGWLLFLLWVLLGRWIRLIEDGVARAPMFWQPLSSYGDNVLELRRDPAGAEAPVVHLVRYVADCPVCGKERGRSAVRLDSGRIEFFGRRIVGRCRYAPNAHIWGFDQVTRKGRFLR